MVRNLKRGEVDVSIVPFGGWGCYDVQVTRRHWDGTCTTFRKRTSGGMKVAEKWAAYGKQRTRVKD